MNNRSLRLCVFRSLILFLSPKNLFNKKERKKTPTDCEVFAYNFHVGLWIFQPVWDHWLGRHFSQPLLESTKSVRITEPAVSKRMGSGSESCDIVIKGFFFFFVKQYESPTMDISVLYQIFPDEVLGSGQFGIVYAGKKMNAPLSFICGSNNVIVLCLSVCMPVCLSACMQL